MAEMPSAKVANIASAITVLCIYVSHIVFALCWLLHQVAPYQSCPHHAHHAL